MTYVQQKIDGEKQKECVCVCVCVCVRERERERVCVCVLKREISVCMKEREREWDEIRERKKLKMLAHQILASKSRVKGKKYHQAFRLFGLK